MVVDPRARRRLEWSYSRGAPTAQRLRFLLDLGYATGLRAGEFVGATLGDIRRDEHGDQRLHVIGKGENPARWRCLRWISLWFSVGCRSRRLAGTGHTAGRKPRRGWRWH